MPEIAVKPDRIRMGDALAEIGRRAGQEDGDLIFDRDSVVAEPIDLSSAGFDLLRVAVSAPAEPAPVMVETSRRVAPWESDASDDA